MPTATWISASTNVSVQAALARAAQVKDRRQKVQEAKSKLFILELDLAESQQTARSSYKAVIRALIIDLVATQFGFDEAALMSSYRPANLAWARSVAMYLVAQGTPLTHRELGPIFKRDHSTITYAVRHVQRCIREDKILDSEVGRLAAKFADALPSSPI